MNVFPPSAERHTPSSLAAYTTVVDGFDAVVGSTISLRTEAPFIVAGPVQLAPLLTDV